jgi:hypothetical protein
MTDLGLLDQRLVATLPQFPAAAHPILEFGKPCN